MLERSERGRGLCCARLAGVVGVVVLAGGASARDFCALLRLGSVDTPGTGVSVAVAGTIACVADGGFGVRVIDVTDPDAPVEVGSYDAAWSAAGVMMAGARAYVAAG